jgi:superfamily I DNA/RNA helicase
VLFRISNHSGQLETELTRRNIPFVKLGGLNFLDAAHIKAMLAMLRFRRQRWRMHPLLLAPATNGLFARFQN